MRNKICKFCALILFSLALTGLNAQEAIPAAGDNASGSGGSSSFTIGQLVYSTNSGSTASVAEGVQQPYEISTITAIEVADGINLFIEAYPNPASDYLTLRIDEYDISNLSFQLFDINGRLLQNDKITNRVTRIIMSNLVPATYFVKIIQSNIEIKTFKIIKN